MGLGIAASACAIVSAASAVLWVPVLRRMGTFDIPSARSSHDVPTLRAAGLAPLTGVVVGALVWVGFDTSIAFEVGLIPGLVVLVAGLGLAEDVVGLPVPARAAGQLLVGFLATAGVLVVTGAPPWLLLVGTVWFAGYVNVANFMDGVDGMSAFHGMVAGAHFVVVGAVLHQPWVYGLGALTAAAFLGFAPWNLSSRRVFLGDVGSYLLGGLVASAALVVVLAGGPVLLALAPTLPYLVDTTVTFLGRARRRERLLEPHRGHVYQRLLDRGWTHRGSAALVAATTMACSVAALWGWAESSRTLPAAVTVGVLVAYVSSPRWGRPRQRRLA